MDSEGIQIPSKPQGGSTSRASFKKMYMNADVDKQPIRFARFHSRQKPLLCEGCLKRATLCCMSEDNVATKLMNEIPDLISPPWPIHPLASTRYPDVYPLIR